MKLIEFSRKDEAMIHVTQFPMLEGVNQLDVDELIDMTSLNQ